jgi:hypothetical protein
MSKTPEKEQVDLPLAADYASANGSEKESGMIRLGDYDEWDAYELNRSEFYPLPIENIILESEKALLIGLRSSSREGEHTAWFPKSVIELGEIIHVESRDTVIYVKGWFLRKLLRGEDENDDAQW